MDLKSKISRVSHRQHDSLVLTRLLRATGLMLGVFVLGTVGYYAMGKGDYTVLDCAYMTVITLTTVGFEEVIPVRGDARLEIFTIFLIFTGMGTVLYFLSLLTAFVVEGELRDILWLKRMKKQIENMEGHFILAGLGETGSYVFPEFVQSKRQCVIIELDHSRVLQVFGDRSDAPFVEGDATDDHVLLEAGIERADGVVFSLGNDRDNLFATISARRLNPDITIVTRGEDPSSEKKFLMAGATSVIFTNVLGGMRMAAEAMRPEVTTFLDIMMRDHGHFRRVEEIPVPEGSPIIGTALRDLGIREVSDALVIAINESNGDYQFNPGPEFVIKADHKLVLLVLVEDVPKIEKLIQPQ